MVAELAELGQAIDQLRQRLGMEPFALRQRLEASRGRVGQNDVGESRQVKAWLAELGEA